jgi:hypothetical protein
MSTEYDFPGLCCASTDFEQEVRAAAASGSGQQMKIRGGHHFLERAEFMVTIGEFVKVEE